MPISRDNLLRTAALLLDDDGHARIQSLLPSDVRAVRVRTLSALPAQLEAGRTAVLILDPALVTPEAAAGILGAAADACVRPLISFSARRNGGRSVLTCARQGAAELLVSDSSVAKAVLYTATRPGVEVSVLSKVARALGSNLARLPDAILDRTLPLLGWSPVPLRKRYIASCALDARTVERHFARAGFVGVHDLLEAVRFARVWQALDHYSTLEAAAADHGYGGSRTLSERCRRLLGTALRRSSSLMSHDDAVRRIVEAITRTAM